MKNLKSLNNGKVTKGTVFNYQFGDSYPRWRVYEIFVNVVNAIGIDSDNKNIKGVFATIDVQNSIASAKMWDDMQRKHDEEWFTRLKAFGLKVGDFIHDKSDAHDNVVIRYKILDTGEVIAVGVCKIDKRKKINNDFLVLPYKVFEEILLSDRYKLVIRKPTWLTDYAVNPRIWSNRTSDFAELYGDFGYQKLELLPIPKLSATAQDKKWLSELNNKNSVYNKLKRLISSESFNKPYNDFLKNVNDAIK